MYCKQCELRLRRGLRPDPACLECRTVAKGGVPTYRQIPLDINRAMPRREDPPALYRTAEPRAQQAPASDRLRGHLVCSACRRLVLPSIARAAGDRIFCATCFDALPCCRFCGEHMPASPDGDRLCPSCSAQATPCERCGEPVMPSELYMCDGRSFCESCYDGLEECDKCGSKMYLYDENAITLLCAECRVTHTACELCGAIVDNGSVFTAEDHPVCPRCFDRLEECEDCGNAIFAHPDDPLHPRLCAQCLDRYVLCESCREPIPLEESDRYIVDERVLCENCYDDLPECEECYRRFYPDPSEERGTVACPACRDNFTACDLCGARVRFTDAYEWNGQLLCSDCNCTRRPR